MIPAPGPAPARTGQKTYWHLMGARRMPSDYEVVTSRLLYHGTLGFAVDCPVSEWVGRWGMAPQSDEAGFADPRETTYATYVRRKQEQELYLDRICASPLAPLGAGALALWERVAAVARFPLHGLQMVAAYCGSMAPWGRLTVALAFQSADEMQRVHRLAYRMAQLRSVHPQLGEASRNRWEREPCWQGARATIEKMLCTWRWEEAFLALNTQFKPLWDGLVFGQGSRLAKRLADAELAAILECLEEDGRWHQEWTRAALRALWPDAAARRSALQECAARWRPAARPAAAKLAAEMDRIAGDAEASKWLREASDDEGG